jgi:nucleosome binding factor SPN SPT16 subunit
MVKKVVQIQVNQILAFNKPYEYAIDLLHRLYLHVYDPLFVTNKGSLWSAVLKCRSATRLAIEYLGYEFPNDILIISDIVPTLLNSNVKGSLKTAESRETSNKS